MRVDEGGDHYDVMYGCVGRSLALAAGRHIRNNGKRNMLCQGTKSLRIRSASPTDYGSDSEQRRRVL